MTNPAIDVLVVDDDDLTAELVERSLAKVGLEFRVLAAEDGCVALDMLKGRAEKTVRRPRIILLDLNMPRMNGFEFLSAIRQDKTLSDSIVFILTTSDADADLTRAYQEQVAGYMVKTNAGPHFSHVAALLRDYRDAVHLPN